MLKLMYITNKPAVAQIAENAGVDWIFVDMEFIGKESRQGGLDTVQNHHTHEDIRNIKSVLTKAKVLVRVNPVHNNLPDYMSSEREIDLAIESGADIIMLPFFKTEEEVTAFVKLVNGRAKVCLLLETPEAVSIIDDILAVDGIDMIHIGLNDLHLAMGKKFMFELLSDGTVDAICEKIRRAGIQYGFGGLATLDGGAVPGRMILKEHYRLGSRQVIVSRSFCNTDLIPSLEDAKDIFEKGIAEIRNFEQKIMTATPKSFEENRLAVADAVKTVVNGMK